MATPTVVQAPMLEVQHLRKQAAFTSYDCASAAGYLKAVWPGFSFGRFWVGFWPNLGPGPLPTAPA